MSASDSADVNHAAISFEWILSQNKIRDGQHGPVFSAMRADNGHLITAERLDVDPAGDPSVQESIVSYLEKKQVRPGQPNIVSYLGYQLKEGHVFVLREFTPGGTLRDFIRQNGAVPQSLVRLILRQVLLGLQQLQKQGFAVVFLDLSNIFIDNKAGVRIEAPLLDITVSGRPLPSTILTFPEVIMSQQNMRKADVWLFGMVAAQLLSGQYSLAAASDIATRIQHAQGSAWELLTPQNVKRGELGGQAADLLHKCFIM